MIISIIRTYLQKSSVKDVKVLAKRHNVKGYSKMRKNEILNAIIERLAIIIIQRFFRKKLSLNDKCPISLDDIMYPCWSIKTEKGRIYYNLESLASYLVTRGDFRDPSTRQTYSDKELDNMESLIKSNNIKLNRSIKKAKNNPHIYRRIKDNDEQIDIIQERLRFVSCNIRDNIEEIHRGYADIKEFTTQLDNIMYPAIKDYIRLLYRREKNLIKYTIDTMIKIVNDTTFDCQVSKHLKNMVIEWLLGLKRRY